MAKRKRVIKRKTKRVKSRKRGSATSSLMMTMLGAGVYGGVRANISDRLSPITSRIPAGELADEVGMGVLNYLLAKGKIPMINKIKISRDIGKAGLMIESARVGSFIAQRGLSGLSTGGNTDTSSGNIF